MFEKLATEEELERLKRLKIRYENAVNRVFSLMETQKNNPSFKEAQSNCRILDREITTITMKYAKDNVKVLGDSSR